MIIQLHNQLFVYKHHVSNPNSFKPSSFTPNSFIKAKKQQQYSLWEIRKTLLTLSILYIFFRALWTTMRTSSFMRESIINEPLWYNFIYTWILSGNNSITGISPSSYFWEIPDKPPCCVRLLQYLFDSFSSFV